MARYQLVNPLSEPGLLLENPLWAYGVMDLQHVQYRGVVNTSARS